MAKGRRVDWSRVTGGMVALKKWTMAGKRSVNGQFTHFDFNQSSRAAQ